MKYDAADRTAKAGNYATSWPRGSRSYNAAIGAPDLVPRSPEPPFAMRKLRSKFLVDVDAQTGLAV